MKTYSVKVKIAAETEAEAFKAYGVLSEGVQLEREGDEALAADTRIELGPLNEYGDTNDQAAIVAATAYHASEGELEIDDDAIVSFSSDGGAYVQAWVWVDDASIKANGGNNPETAGKEEGGNNE